MFALMREEASGQLNGTAIARGCRQLDSPSHGGRMMISQKTVLVLGAGASTHCGYPLGRRLVSDLCDLRRTAALDSLPRRSRPKADVFLTRLSHSDPDSIDAFLEREPDLAPLGKYLIAHALKSREILDNLFPSHDAGWYRTLFSVLVAPGGGPISSRSKVSVVTFNYDRSLEAYLHTRLQSHFGVDPDEATSILTRLPIVHLHGILGDFPAVPYQPVLDPGELQHIARRIRIIHELVDTKGEFCSPQFRKANKMLHQAERIFFLGFGFHPDNLRRFQFFSAENLAAKTVKATGQGMGPIDRDHLVARLSKMGFKGEDFVNCSCNEFFSYAASLT